MGKKKQRVRTNSLLLAYSLQKGRRWANLRTATQSARKRKRGKETLETYRGKGKCDSSAHRQL